MFRGSFVDSIGRHFEVYNELKNIKYLRFVQHKRKDPDWGLFLNHLQFSNTHSHVDLL
jgi:hypothetical protein